MIFKQRHRYRRCGGGKFKLVQRGNYKYEQHEAFSGLGNLHTTPGRTRVIHINDELIRRILDDASTKGFTLFKRNLYAIVRERKTILILGVLLLPSLLSLYWAAEGSEEDFHELNFSAHEFGNEVDTELVFPRTLYTEIDLVQRLSLRNTGDREVVVYLNGTIQDTKFSCGPYTVEAGSYQDEEMVLSTKELERTPETEVLLYTEIVGTDYTMDQLLTDIQKEGYNYSFVQQTGPIALQFLTSDSPFTIPPEFLQGFDMETLARLYNATRDKAGAIHFLEVEVIQDAAFAESRLSLPQADHTVSFDYENHSREIALNVPQLMTYDSANHIRGWVVDNSSSWDFQVKIYLSSSFTLISSSQVYDSGEVKNFNLTIHPWEFPSSYQSEEITIVYFFANATGILVDEQVPGARYRIMETEVLTHPSRLQVKGGKNLLNFTLEKDSLFVIFYPAFYLKGFNATLAIYGSINVPHPGADPNVVTLFIDEEEAYRGEFQAGEGGYLDATYQMNLDDYEPDLYFVEISVYNAFLKEYRNSSIVAIIQIVEEEAYYDLIPATQLSFFAGYGIDLRASVDFPEILSTRDKETVELEIYSSGLVEHDLEFFIETQDLNMYDRITVNASSEEKLPFSVPTEELVPGEEVDVVFLLKIRKMKFSEENGSRGEDGEQGSLLLEPAQGFGGFDDFEEWFLEDENTESGKWQDEEFIYIKETRTVYIVETKKANLEAISVFLGLFTQLYLLFLVLIVCMVYGSMMIKDEIENKTMHLLLVSPLTRFEIVVYKYLAYVVGVFLILMIPITVNYLIVTYSLGASEMLFNIVVLANTLFITFLAVACYGTVYMLIGALPKHPIFLGVTFAIFWEGFIGRLPFFLQHFTLNHYLRSVMLPLMEEYVLNSGEMLSLVSFDGKSLATSPFLAFIILAVVPFALLILNIVFLRTRDFS